MSQDGDGSGDVAPNVERFAVGTTKTTEADEPVGGAAGSSSESGRRSVGVRTRSILFTVGLRNEMTNQIIGVAMFMAVRAT